MGRRTNEIDNGNEALNPAGGRSESGTPSVGAVPADPTDDVVSDASFSEGTAGAAFNDSMIGSPNSENMVSAPYSQSFADDPYGERTGSFGTISDGYTDTDAAPDADDDELQANRIQIEQTRAELSGTIDAIQQKLSPGNLVDQAKETVRDATVGKAQDMVSNVSDTALGAVNTVSDSAKGAGNTFVETIRQNPVPAALAGIGLGWLFVSMRKNASIQGDYGYDRNLPYTYSEDYASGRAHGTEQYYGNANKIERFDDAQGRAGEFASQAQDRVGDLAGRAQERASDLANQAQTTVSQVGDQVAGAASQTAGQAQDTVRRTTNNISTMMRENPLGVGAAAIALGLVAGLAIPETAKEDQLMGDARESLTNKAQQTVQQTAQKVQNVAQEAVSAGKQEAQDQNLM